jgi:hypothetical protein
MDAPAIEFLPAGISRSQADGRYVRRLVGTTLTAETYLGDNSAGVGQERVLANPNGPIMAGIPQNLAPILAQSGDGARIATRVRIMRLGNSGAVVGMRINGTFAAPTQNLASDTMQAFFANALTDTGTLVTPTSYQASLRENATATTFGSQQEFFVCDLGAAVLKSVLRIRGGGANIGEWGGQQATTRIVVLTTGQIRTPANTANLIEWNATGLGFNNSAPIAKPTITGSRGANAALASLLTALASYGLVTDSTTV